jgi:hypothetical protein
MLSNRKQRDLKSASIVVGTSASSSEFLGGGTYVKKENPNNVQSMSKN